MQSEKMRKMNGTDTHRRIVCRRCGLIMGDIEDMTAYGEFFHGPRHPKKGAKQRTACVNDWKTFDLSDTKEVMPFVRKSIRRAAKRAGTSV